jgi:hypothetical protein
VGDGSLQRVAVRDVVGVRDHVDLPLARSALLARPFFLNALRLGQRRWLTRRRGLVELLRNRHVWLRVEQELNGRFIFFRFNRFLIVINLALLFKVVLKG